MVQKKELMAIEWAYLRGFCFTILVLIFSYGIAWLLNRLYPLSKDTIEYIEITGLVFDGTALFGIITVHARSLSGFIQEEKTNHIFLLTCVAIGLIAYFVAHFLDPAL